MIARCKVTRKRSYWTEASAQAVIDRLAVVNAAKHQPTPVRCYRCRHCSLWHMTKKKEVR